MKSIVLTILAFIVALEAKPQPFFGLRKLGIGGLRNRYVNGMFGLSTIGTGIVGLGCGSRIISPVQIVVLGLGRRCSGFGQDGSFGNNGYNYGASGFGSQSFHSTGGKNFHDVGEHHSSLTSINHAENTDNHDIGGSEIFDKGAQTRTGFNQFGNGFNRYGNEYGSGKQMKAIQ